MSQIQVQQGTRDKDIGTPAQPSKPSHPGLMSFGSTLYEISIAEDETPDESTTNVTPVRSKTSVQEVSINSVVGLSCLWLC